MSRRRTAMSVLSRSALESSPLADLHAIASELGLDGFRRLRKADLVDRIVAHQGGDDDGSVAEEVVDEAASELEARPRRRSRGGRGRGRSEAEAEAAEVDADAEDEIDEAEADVEGDLVKVEDEAAEEEPEREEREEREERDDRPARRGRGGRGRGGRDRDSRDRDRDGD